VIDLYREWSGIGPASLDGWEMVPHLEQGEVVAIAALHGTEIHFVAAPSWRGRVIQRDRTRAFLSPLLERRGFLTTRSMDGESARFLRRLGFTHMWTEGLIQHWMLTALPFGRGEN
jgi:hypothetical protein